MMGDSFFFMLYMLPLLELVYFHWLFPCLGFPIFEYSGYANSVVFMLSICETQDY